MAKFTIRGNWAEAQDLANLAYIVGKEVCKVTIRQNSAFVHINVHNCLMVNQLRYLRNNNLLEADKKSLEWLRWGE